MNDAPQDTRTVAELEESLRDPRPEQLGPARLAEIRRQVKIGQRPAGSPQLRRLAVRLRKRMPHGRFEKIPGEPRLRNVVGTVPGAKPALVIGAHYDTLVKPKGFVGANNGAAGSAIGARSPLLGLRRFTSAITEDPAPRKCGIGSSGAGTSASAACRSRSGRAWRRDSRSSRTPATISSRTEVS